MNDLSGTIEHEPGPSWARPNWPVSELDEVNAGLDPTDAVIGKAAADKAAAAGADPEAVRRAAEDSIRAMMLIRTYRVRGHLAAKLDPLGLHHSEIPADLTPAYHGFGPDDLDRPIHICGVLGFKDATVRELVEVLQANYCGTIGVEYMHINDL
ncbi:MAG: 2-oxoglutarate dehydrogenase E1 component, partial [Sphingomonas sp.]|nr:2-oxoglutarate dehydrogenase E1 component [Sphingomonas sp.]